MSEAQSFPLQIQLAENSAEDAVSPAGAQSSMQVMPGTAAGPGFGVRPAASPNDLDRLGRDYAEALLGHYASPVLAAAAYNAGPGRVNQWLRTIGDPRTGQISPADWVAKLPFAETRAYAGKFLTNQLGGQGVQQQRASTGQTGNLLAMQQSAVQPQVQDQTESKPQTSGGPDPVAALRLLALATPNHQLVPVDYDPWAVAKASHVG